MPVKDNINYVVAGDKDPALIFVHGFGCSHTDWRNQIAGLRDRFRCVALDLPGHGASAPLDDPTIPALAAAVNAVKEDLDAEEVVLIGHSLGTKLVREALHQSDEGVIGVVLVDGSLNIGDVEVQRTKARDAIRRAGFAAYADTLFRSMFVEGTDPALVEEMVAQAKSLDPAYAEKVYIEAGGWDSMNGLEQLRRISVPLLVLQSSYYNINFGRTPLTKGERTPLMEAVEQVVSDYDIEVIEGCGHFTMLDDPDAVNASVAAFATKQHGRRVVPEATRD